MKPRHEPRRAFLAPSPPSVLPGTACDPVRVACGALATMFRIWRYPQKRKEVF